MKLLNTVIIFFILALTYAHSEEINASTYRESKESIQKLIPDDFEFLGSDYVERATPFIENEVDLNQLLTTSLITPSKEYLFIEEIKKNKEEDSVVIWSGILPFITIPNSTDEDGESVFSKDSAAFFFHVKKKF